MNKSVNQIIYIYIEREGGSWWYDGQRNRYKRVRTPVVLLRSFSDEWERYESPYPTSYALNSTTTVLLKGWLRY